jgi:O-succinylhomoserine sulfhydrylase
LSAENPVPFIGFPAKTDHRAPDVSGLRPRSQLVHGGSRRSQFDETCEAIYQTSGYCYGSAEEAEAAFANDGARQVYSRFGNPTSNMFEARMCAYEGAEWGYATASGMAAVTASLLSFVKTGDRVVAPIGLFISCLYVIREICTRFGVEAVLIDGTDLDQWKEALSKPTTAVFLESPSNPCLEIVDIAEVAKLAKAAGAKVIVDNAFATPVLQRPFTLGADMVIYSATKHIDGQGRCLGGIIMTDRQFAVDKVHPFVRHTGPTIAPFNAWLLLKSLETLELRVGAQCAAALKVAQYLENHDRVAKTVYPFLESHPQHDLARRQMTGGGTMVSFYIDGGKAEAFRAMNALKMVLISNNLGDSKSLITHPDTSTHCKLPPEDKLRAGITPALIRLSVGLEDADDIIDDLDRALAAL